MQNSVKISDTQVKVLLDKLVINMTHSPNSESI